MKILAARIITRQAKVFFFRKRLLENLKDYLEKMRPLEDQDEIEAEES